jgi:hypothetical protein
MCDYSITANSTREAKAGDQLITKVFYASTGFADANDPSCAVCLKEGTEVAFARGYALVKDWPLWPSKVRSGVATFRKIDTHMANVHHDALEFDNGRVVKLHDFVVDQYACVLTLPVSENEKFNPPKHEPPWATGDVQYDARVPHGA